MKVSESVVRVRPQVGLPQHYQSFVLAAEMPLIYFQRSGCQYNGREVKKWAAFN